MREKEGRQGLPKRVVVAEAETSCPAFDSDGHVRLLVTAASTSVPGRQGGAR
jgi:hypothetical protein